MGEDKIRIIIADDSAIIRGILDKLFKSDGGFEVVDSVSNGRKAYDSAKMHDVDAIISDIDMPELNGIESTKLITKELGVPVIILSEDVKLKSQAIDAGALFFEPKPALSALRIENLKNFTEKVKAEVKKLGRRHSHPITDIAQNGAGQEFKILCIGASTGGPGAVQYVLSRLGNNFKLPILYTQHLDVGADKKMADWFDESCPNITVRLAKDGEEAKPGIVYMAPADVHLEVDYIASSGNPVLKLSKDPPERFLRPAVNKLFRTAAKFYKESCLAVLMTGMGRDGAEGCKVVLENGGYTIVEDKSTCAVFGMPAAAIELNAAKEILPRTQIADRILHYVGK